MMGYVESLAVLVERAGSRDEVMHLGLHRVAGRETRGRGWNGMENVSMIGECDYTDTK